MIDSAVESLCWIGEFEMCHGVADGACPKLPYSTQAKLSANLVVSLFDDRA